ncbi:hypothetical protein HMI55_005497, partial [Coelomomyces lativittatus]
IFLPAPHHMHMLGWSSSRPIYYAETALAPVISAATLSAATFMVTLQPTYCNYFK